MQRSGRVACAILMVITMSFAGCLSGGSSSSTIGPVPDWDKDMVYVDDPMGHEDARFFEVASPFSNQSWGNSSWAVFGMKKEEIAVNTILRQPRKVGFLISGGNILLGLKTEGILGKNIDLAFFHRLVVGNLSRPYQVKKGLEREALCKQPMVT